MFARVSSSESWTCSRCLRQIKRKSVTRRLHSVSQSRATAEPSAIANDRTPITYARSTSTDDQTLRRIFDSPDFWRDFNSKRLPSNREQNAGLFQNRYLTSPEGFRRFASTTEAKCRRIVAKVLTYKSVEEYQKIAQDLDRLSDLLCRVIDMSDFIRAVHPSSSIQKAATQSYAQMFEYMNVLNTATGLNDQLKRAMAIPEVWDSWSEEEKIVAQILEHDFSKSAIDMEESHRQAFVETSSEIVEVGAAFVDGMSAEKPYLTLDGSSLKGMDPMVVRQLTSWNQTTLPMLGPAPRMALQSVTDANVRREIYTAHRTSSQASIYRLEKLLKKRAELAKVAGFESYGHMTLAERMASTPEAVNSFLDAVSKDNASRARQDKEDLTEVKRQDLEDQTLTLNAWDRDFYTARLLNTLRLKSRNPDFLSAYFSLGTVMQGLSLLYHRLYGIRLVPRETLPGETWNSDVRRLDVIDDRDGHVAVMYCDLFERAGKSPNPAHFTLRCSRKIRDEEFEEAKSLAEDNIFETLEQAVNDGLSTAINKHDGSLYQLPTIALICDFAINSSKHRPALLTFREVRTLFHEMGHALHSICGRTQLQTVAGTRCATDLAELPSVLNESFASAPEVLALWSKHWETDQPLDVARAVEKVKLERRIEGLEIEAQVMMGVLDQRYHSSAPLNWKNNGNPSTEMYRDVWREYSSIPEPATSWNGYFGHLFTYGSIYYSYLFDRAIAGKIWRDVFQRTDKGALDPEAGQRYREEILRWGGGRDGWKCVGGLLGGEEGEIVKRGGKEAMEKVGSWGVHDSW